MRTALTVSLVEAARQGPFVYHGSLREAAQAAKQFGFAALELFAPGPDATIATELRGVLDESGLKLAAVGTGAGWLNHQWSLTSPSAEVRGQAEDFIASMLDFGAGFGAPVIIGSMQGRHGGDVSRDQALDWLRTSLERLGRRAASAGTAVWYEPLNRYETNLCNRLEQAVALLEPLSGLPVKILADLFHMNIEETDLAAALRSAGSKVGHIHFVDSNRQAVGRGHSDLTAMATALKKLDYQGYLSVEAFPIPSSEEAARQTQRAVQLLFPQDDASGALA